MKITFKKVILTILILFVLVVLYLGTSLALNLFYKNTSKINAGKIDNYMTENKADTPQKTPESLLSKEKTNTQSFNSPQTTPESIKSGTSTPDPNKSSSESSKPATPSTNATPSETQNPDLPANRGSYDEFERIYSER